jgi:hypothetical protein
VCDVCVLCLCLCLCVRAHSFASLRVCVRARVCTCVGAGVLAPFLLTPDWPFACSDFRQLCVAGLPLGRPLPKIDRALYLDADRYLVTRPPVPSAKPLVLHEVELACDANKPRPRRVFETASPDVRRRVLLELADMDRANTPNERFVAQLRLPWAESQPRLLSSTDRRLFAAYAPRAPVRLHDGRTPRTREAGARREPSGACAPTLKPVAARAGASALAEPPERSAAATAAATAGAVSDVRWLSDPQPGRSEQSCESPPWPGEDGLGWAKDGRVLPKKRDRAVDSVYGPQGRVQVPPAMHRPAELTKEPCIVASGSTFDTYDIAHWV